MRERLSVFAAMAHSSIYKVIGIIALMGAAQFAITYYLVERSNISFAIDLEIATWCERIFMIAFIITVFALAVVGFESRGKVRYTLRRLSISEQSVFAVQAVYNFLALLLFYLSQILISIGVVYMYTELVGAEFVSTQTRYLSFFRAEFFRSILPLEDFPFFARNIVFLLHFAILGAFFPMREKREIKNAFMIISLAIVAAVFTQGIRWDWSTFYIAAVALFDVALIGSVFTEEKRRQNEYGKS